MRIIRLDENKIVVESKYVNSDYILKKDESFSETGIVGQIKQQDETFIDPEPTQTTPETTLEDKINFIYYKQMGVL